MKTHPSRLPYATLVPIIIVTSLSFAQAAANDFDRDGISDVAVVREHFPWPGALSWFVSTSSGAPPLGPGWNVIPGTRGYWKAFGLSGDAIVPGDYDVDGATDPAVVRPGFIDWYVGYSSGAPVQRIQLGLPGDQLIPGEYTRKGRTDMATYRPWTREAFVRDSNTGQIRVYRFTPPPGTQSTVALPQGWTVGDTSADVAVVFRLNTTPPRIIWRVAAGQIFNRLAPDGNLTVLSGNYGGTTLSDLVLWNSATGQWWIQIDSDSGAYPLTPVWGGAGTLPIVGDFDGDGKDDLCYWQRSDATWHVFSSGHPWKTPPHMTYVGAFHYMLQWGFPWDQPVR